MVNSRRATSSLAPAPKHTTLELSYDDYVAQVVAYLAPEHAALYESPDAWTAMQLRVMEFLEGVSP